VRVVRAAATRPRSPVGQGVRPRPAVSQGRPRAGETVGRPIPYHCRPGRGIGSGEAGAPARSRRAEVEREEAPPCSSRARRGTWAGRRARLYAPGARARRGRGGGRYLFGRSRSSSGEVVAVGEDGGRPEPDARIAPLVRSTPAARQGEIDLWATTLRRHAPRRSLGALPAAAAPGGGGGSRLGGPPSPWPCRRG
jgi:hypothetical protein